jgi:hypothetical protein
VRAGRRPGRRGDPRLDEQYVVELGLGGEIAGWREIAARVVAAS